MQRNLFRTADFSSGAQQLFVRSLVTMKRPAACISTSEIQYVSASVNTPAPLSFTDDKFTIKGFAQLVFHELGVARSPGDRKCILITGCSGVGTPTFAVEGLLGKKHVHEVFAVERKPEAAWFLCANTNPDHVFCDMSEVTRDSFATCFKHVVGFAKSLTRC